MDPCNIHNSTRRPAAKTSAVKKPPVEAKAPAKPSIWESDTTQDIQELFSQLDAKFFQGKMKKNGVLLEWTEKASLTAGYCYQLSDDVQGMKRCYIMLNKPLLRSRSRKDLVETLLHEMIHALLYTAGIKENHGPHFRHIMKNINEVAGTNITVSHAFHDEVGRSADLATKFPKELKLPMKPMPMPMHMPMHMPMPMPIPAFKYAPGHCADLTTVRKPADEHHKVKFPVVGAPPLHPGIIPACRAKPKTPLRRQPSQSKTELMSEILGYYKGAVPDRQIELLGYDSEPDYDTSSDSDSDYDFTDSDSDFEYDREKATMRRADERMKEMLLKRRELFHMKEDLKPWMDFAVYKRR